MTVIKLTKSGKGVQIVDDQGNVFGTSRKYLLSLLMGTAKYPLIKCDRMPFTVDPDRFGVSELWIPEGVDREYIEEQERIRAEKGTDAFSRKNIKESEDRKKYAGDDNVW